MRIVLADLKGIGGGHVSKDTITGGYGSRFRGISKATKVAEILRKIFENFPSIHTAYLAAIFSQAGHDVHITRKDLIAGDLALVLSSIVDYRHEIDWAEQFRKRYGSPVGFFGTFATFLPEQLDEHADFVIQGEPEEAAMRLAGGETFKGRVLSHAITNLDSLPFPRWDLAGRQRFGHSATRSILPIRRAFPILSSRSCPEFCTYCPHRITATYRARSPQNVVDEIEYLCRKYGKLDLVFRDPLFSEERERSTAIAEGIIRKKLPVRFECETRLDDLDTQLIDLLYEAGLRSITFGVESLDPVTLKKVGRRPIPPEHQAKIISHCTSKGIRTIGFYVFGFLTDTAESIHATISYSIDLKSTGALFKILTPYPGTPLRKQMNALVTETDLQKFDGYTPTFTHPHLSHKQLLSLLKSAYARFYFRPSWALNYFNLQKYFRKRVEQWDAYALQTHTRNESRNHVADALHQSTAAGE